MPKPFLSGKKPVRKLGRQERKADSPCGCAKDSEAPTRTQEGDLQSFPKLAMGAAPWRGPPPKRHYLERRRAFSS